jgi:ABC-type amino acid transport substrate-binding protein
VRSIARPTAGYQMVIGPTSCVDCRATDARRSVFGNEDQKMLQTLRRGSIVLVMLVGSAALAQPKPAARPAAEDNLYELDTAAQKAPAAGSPFAKVLQSMYIRACVRSDVAPFGSFSANGLQGFDIDLASEITQQLSIDYKQALRVEWTVVSADDRMKRVQDGSCDILVADFSYTKDRAAQIGTSKVYLRTDKVLVAASKITRKVPVIAKLATATGDASDVKGTVRAFRSYQEIVHAMDDGEVDYVVTDRPIALHLIRSATQPYTIAKTLAENAEGYVVGVAAGDPELLAAVNRALDDLAHDGRLALLDRRWL